MADLITMLSAAAGAGKKADPNFNQTVLLLHGDGTNGAQNNTFLDSSTNNFTITRNGNTTQGTFSPFSLPNGQWSNFFDGSGDTLSVPANSAFSFGTNSFTIEAWVYLSTVANNASLILNGNYNGSNGDWIVRIGAAGAAAGKWEFTTWHGGGVFEAISNSAPIANQWTHIAAVKNGNTQTLYINGVAQTTTATNTNSVGYSNQTTLICGNNGSGILLTGYVSNLRVVKGTAVYTTGFTPSTAPLTAITNTSLLTCQSNRFVDNSTNNFAITRNGDVSVQPFSPFLPSAEYDPSVNGGSGYFDGSGDYLSIADAAGLRFGTGNFTIQCWIYRNAAGAVHSIAAKGGASTGWVFQVHSDNKLRFTHTTTNIDSTGTIPASAWTHVAVVREGTGTNQVKLYINGVQDGQGTVSTNFNQTEQLNIGADRGNSNVMNGYISGWKYVVGTAETITVPTAPPTGGTALLNFTNAGIFDNTGKNNLETVGNAQIDTTTKKYGTGSMEFDGTGDWLIAPTTPNCSFETGDFTIEGWIYPTATTGADRCIFDTRNTASDSGMVLFIDSSTANLRVFSSNGIQITSTSAVTINAWQHIALVRLSGTLAFYIDGTQVGTNSYASAITCPGRIYIGVRFDLQVPYTGFIDDLRITKGVARYTTTFTPPSRAFPDL